MREIYRPLFLGGKSPLIEMSRRGAELTKYAGNAFLATKITFINEIADLCEKVGADVREVARGIGLDNRIGGKFLNAGPGYGGSCFPKDTVALLKTAQDFEAPQRIVEAVVAVNDNRKRAMGRKVIAACGGEVRGKRIAVLGLTFKPNTDDMRDSPSIAIIRTLQDAGAQVVACDPEGIEQARAMLDGVEFVADPWEAISGASAAVIVTEWDAYRALDLPRMKSLLEQPVLVDLRNIYDRATAESAGLSYHGVGR
jgi:UDPglucose 6-dehydrogenase